MYQYSTVEKDFTKQKPILEIDLLLDTGARLNLLNEDTWNELTYDNPKLQFTQSIRTLTSANTTKTETLGTIQLDLRPERLSNNRRKLLQTFKNLLFYNVTPLVFKSIPSLEPRTVKFCTESTHIFNSSNPKRMEKSNRKIIYGHCTTSNQ